MAIRDQHYSSLYKAMDHILSEETRSKNDFTFGNLVKIAKVPRSTAFRYKDVAREWKRRVAAAQLSTPIVAIERPRSNKRGGRKADSSQELRRTIGILANYIQVLSLEIESLRRDTAAS